MGDHAAPPPPTSLTRRLALGAGIAGLAAAGFAVVSRNAVAPNVLSGDGLPPERRRSSLIPDVPLITHDGRSVRFRRDCVRDRVVVLGFMYTTCEGSCPTTTWTFRKLRKDLSPIVGVEARMLSITLDPEHDGPVELATYARVHGAPYGGGRLMPWDFLTGRPDDIERLRVALGYRDLDPEVDAVRSNHAAMVTFGNDARDRWSSLPIGMRYTQLRASILRAVAPTSSGAA